MTVTNGVNTPNAEARNDTAIPVIQNGVTTPNVTTSLQMPNGSKVIALTKIEVGTLTKIEAEVSRAQGQNAETIPNVHAPIVLHGNVVQQKEQSNKADEAEAATRAARTASPAVPQRRRKAGRKENK